MKMGVSLKNSAGLPASAAVDFMVLGDDYALDAPERGPPSRWRRRGHVSADAQTIGTDPGEGISELTWLAVRQKGKVTCVHNSASPRSALTCLSAAWACSSSSRGGTQGAKAIRARSQQLRLRDLQARAPAALRPATGAPEAPARAGPLPAAEAAWSTSSLRRQQRLHQRQREGPAVATAASLAAGTRGLLPLTRRDYCTAVGAANVAMQTGCVIPNLSWMGYVDNAGNAPAISEPYVSYSLLDLAAQRGSRVWEEVRDDQHRRVRLSRLSEQQRPRWGWPPMAATPPARRSIKPAAS